MSSSDAAVVAVAEETKKTDLAELMSDEIQKEDDAAAAAANPPPCKKSKGDPLALIAPHVLTQKDDFKQAYAANQPYPHAVLPNLFDAAFLQQVLTEIKMNSVVDFKESDLYKVYQSMDLANLDPNDVETCQKLPHVMQLRQVLYSPDWRHVMEELAALPKDTLSDKVDCACNCHVTGCHLLCHDDVIGSRCISYILYLTDENWSAEEGGALELYPSVDAASEAAQRIPAVIPAKSYLPLFNHMAFFKVEPGVSFHAVQEVLGERPRLSMQGWYHYHDSAVAKEQKNNQQMATLDMLKKRKDDGDAEERSFTALPVDDATAAGESAAAPAIVEPDNADAAEKPVELRLLDADKEYLSKYIEPTYLSTEALTEINELFEDESSVQLQKFFLPKYQDALMQAMLREDEELKGTPSDAMDYSRGVTDDWKLTGPSHKQRFLEYVSDTVAAETDITENSTVGSILLHLKRHVLEHPAFARFLNVATSLGTATASRGLIRRFRPGMDYTVAHHGLLLPPDSPPILDATFCFVKDDPIQTKEKVVEKETKQEGEAGKEEIVAEKEKDDDAGKDEMVVEKDKEQQADAGKEGDGEDDKGEPEDVTWESGNVGGFECYIEADEEGGEDKKGEKTTDPAEEYNPDDDTELLSVSASNNTLSLVLRDAGTMRFVKFVGARAPSSRWDIAMEYQVPYDGDTAEETLPPDEGESKEEILS